MLPNVSFISPRRFCLKIDTLDRWWHIRAIRGYYSRDEIFSSFCHQVSRNWHAGRRPCCRSVAHRLRKGPVAEGDGVSENANGPYVGPRGHTPLMPAIVRPPQIKFGRNDGPVAVG
jgi:hypothetical protein